MLAGLNFQFRPSFLWCNLDFQALPISCADFCFTTSSSTDIVTSWPEKTLSHALFLCPLIVTQSPVLPIWCIIFSFSLYSFPILLSAFSIYFIKHLLWFNSHAPRRILCEAEGNRSGFLTTLADLSKQKDLLRVPQIAWRTLCVPICHRTSIAHQAHGLVNLFLKM